MGKERVDITEKDINLFKFLYKHRYVNLKVIDILYENKPDTLYRRLKKLTEYNYIKVLKIQNMETLFALDFEGHIILSKTEPQKEHKKRNISKQRIPLRNNANHNLIIAEIGAMLSNRNIDYEIDLNIKSILPEWKLIPDILIYKIGFEIELENKSMIRYAKKLSELQNTKEIDKLIYLTPMPQSLQNKVENNEEYKYGNSLDERIILNETKQKINYIKLNNFIENMDEYLNKFNLLSGGGTL